MLDRFLFAFLQLISLPQKDKRFMLIWVSLGMNDLEGLVCYMIRTNRSISPPTKYVWEKKKNFIGVT